MENNKVWFADISSRKFGDAVRSGIQNIIINARCSASADSPLLTELDTPFLRVRCIEYSKVTANAVVHHYHDLQHIGGPLYLSAARENDFGESERDLFLLYDGGKNALRYGTYKDSLLRYMRVDKTLAQFDVLCDSLTLDAFLRVWDCKANMGGFVDNATIDFVRQYDAERAKRYTAARAAYIEKREKEEAKKAEEDAAADAAFVKEQNEKAEAVISETAAKITNKENVKNVSVRFYKSRFEYAEHSVFLVLAQRHGVSIPLRTAGWIARKLISVNFETFQFFWRPEKKTDKPSYKAIDALEELRDVLIGEAEEEDADCPALDDDEVAAFFGTGREAA